MREIERRDWITWALMVTLGLPGFIGAVAQILPEGTLSWGWIDPLVNATVPAWAVLLLATVGLALYSIRRRSEKPTVPTPDPDPETVCRPVEHFSLGGWDWSILLPNDVPTPFEFDSTPEARGLAAMRLRIAGPLCPDCRCEVSVSRHGILGVYSYRCPSHRTRRLIPHSPDRLFDDALRTARAKVLNNGFTEPRDALLRRLLDRVGAAHADLEELEWDAREYGLNSGAVRRIRELSDVLGNACSEYLRAGGERTLLPEPYCLEPEPESAADEEIPF